MGTIDVFDKYGDDEPEIGAKRKGEVKCKTCGSADVRWRQQGGRWVLFSLTPGVLHKCPKPSAQEDFK